MKRLFALLLLAASPATATVLVDSQTFSGFQTGSIDLAWNMTIGTGINRAVVIGCEANETPPVLNLSSATVGGVVAYRVHAHEFNGDRSEIWIATGVPSGSQAIHVWLPVGYQGTDFPCGAISFENVNQTSPVNTSTGTNVGGATSSATWTTTSTNTVLVDVMGQGAHATFFTPNSGQTMQWYGLNVGKATSLFASTKLALSSGTQVMGWDVGNSNQIAMSATSLRSAVGAPDITTISPTTKGIGEPGFTLTVNGVSFVNGATVTWNNSNRTTVFVSSTQVTATINASDLLTIQSAQVRVVNPDTARTGAASFAVTGDITYVWATDGGYKPTQDDLYGTVNSTTVTATRIWNGTTVKPFQAKNEINGFALVFENNTVVDSTAVSVGYPVLTGPNGYVISSTPTTKANLWDWRNRPIQLYYVRYLPIRGISRLAWELYDETHVPERLQATHIINGNGQGIITGDWTSRPDHDKYYPDILVPYEAVIGSTFTIASSSSQVVWVDIYVPKNAPTGIYTGSIPIYEGAGISTSIPISLTVYPFTMPDVPYSKPYMVLSNVDINKRHGANGFPNYAGISSTNTQTRLHYYQELWRHGITPAGDSDSGGCGSLLATAPCPEYQMALTGDLFKTTTGYANAPGINTPIPTYMMFAYGIWRFTSYWPQTYAATCSNANTWVTWFKNYAPKTEFFWYLEDEAVDQTNNNRWSTWLTTCPAPGNLLMPFATVGPVTGSASAPTLNWIATTQTLGIAATQEAALKSYQVNRLKRADYYNGARPWSGTLATDDDGVAPRVIEWMQYKKKFDHYFYWQGTNWLDGNNDATENDLFHDAMTFGFDLIVSTIVGRTSFNYNNGDGVLLYPGTDTVYTADSYGIDVPIPSWRLKMLRRGINDFTYLTLAAQYDARAVDSIVQRIIPKVLWDYGVFDTGDPTYQYGPKSWSSDPDVWERAREQLAEIIARHR